MLFDKKKGGSILIEKVLELATQKLAGIIGHTFGQVAIEKPHTQFEALNMLKITSKLSPIIGNLFEIDAVEILTEVEELAEHGAWVRQDPGFPDVLFETGDAVQAGFEVKAWYPFSTEITGRFKDSQNRFAHDQFYVLMFAWTPEHMLWGKPKMLDLCVVSGRSVAAARDNHYHNPPDYLVIEPLDTTKRTRNLQQTNTSGYKWQGTDAEFKEAQKIVAGWGKDGEKYRPDLDYQKQVVDLQGRFKYRLDTNYAKMDRVIHDGIEEFKTRVLARQLEGRTIGEWNRFFANSNNATIAAELKAKFKIEAGTGPAPSAAPAPREDDKSD